MCSFSLTRKSLLTFHKPQILLSQKTLPSLYTAMYLPCLLYFECLETNMMTCSSLLLVQCLLCLVSKIYILYIYFMNYCQFCSFRLLFQAVVFLKYTEYFLQSTEHTYTTRKKKMLEYDRKGYFAKW